MIRKLSILAILALPAICFAQGSCYPAGVVLLDTGRPANGASIRVCQAGSTGTPCTPAASLFTDPTLGTPLGGSPVVTADTHGNFGFCAAAGVNYDLQITGSGITTLNIKNLPLAPSSPITAAALTSASANPANVGTIKLATGDCMDWRNNANSGNLQLCKNTSDQFTFSGALVSQGIVNPSTTGTDSGAETLTNKTLTSPTSTGTDSGTETLTNKTLASPAFSGTATGTAVIPTTLLKTAPGLLQFGCTGTATSSASNLVLTFNTCATTTGFVIPAGTTGTIKNLFCQSVIAGSTAGSGVMTVRKNVVNQVITCTIGTATRCSDTTHSISVSSTDSIDIVYATGAAETLNGIACTIEKGT